MTTAKDSKIARQVLLGICVSTGWLLLLVFVPPSVQAGQYEPNDEIGAATGPIGPQIYSGEFETDQDEDWYWIPLAAQQQIDVAVHFSAFGCSYGGRAIFIDSKGEDLATLDAISQDYGEEGGEEVLHYRYTTPPAPDVYFLRFTGTGPPCAYEFEIGPSSVFAAGLSNPVVHAAEPDDLESSAHGPISADVLYAGAIDTEGDIDQLYMEAEPNAEIEMTMIGYCHERGDIEAAITTPAESTRFNELETTDGYGHGEGTYETGPGGHIYVAISGGVGCHWQFRATPATALRTAPPAPVDRCAPAKHHLKQRKRAVKRLSKALHRAKSPRARGRLHHRVEAARRSVRAAKHLVAVRCS